MTKRRTKAYPGSITRRGDSWRVRLCVGGKYKSFTVPGTKVEAQNFATTNHAELTGDKHRALAGLPGPVHFGEVAKEFQTYELPSLSAGTRESYNSSFTAFRPYFIDAVGDPLVQDIRRGHVKTFLSWRRTHRIGVEDGDTLGVSAHTVARDKRVLARLFNYGIEKDHLEFNPCHRVRSPKADPRNPPILTAEQLDGLLVAAEPNPMLHTFILILAETGIRAYSEALQLRWEDIDLADGFLHVKSAPGRRTKSGKSRDVSNDEAAL